MLRVTTLYASSAAATSKYYTRYLTDAPGEVPGQWTGQQADRLGLAGTVSTEALENLLSGHDPCPVSCSVTHSSIAPCPTER